MYTKLVSSLLFPMHERLKRHDSVAVRLSMEQSQWLSSEELEKLQVGRLRSMLDVVGREVPFYRNMFVERGFSASSVQSLEALERLPLLDKATIRGHLEAMKRDNAPSLSRFNTGGSSGEPLIFFLSNERVSHDVAAKWRATRWWGVDIGDPEIVMWGSPIELKAQDAVRRLRDTMLRSALIPAFDMSESALDEHVRTIQSKRPRMLFGYPSALTKLAEHARAKGVDLSSLGIRVVFVTSERLYDAQRETLQGVFGCPVANGYGGRDAGFIAHECPAGGMHITAEDVIVELLDGEGRPVADGQPGEIVVTHLATKDFPFIRYRTGDVAVRDRTRCACGRGLPMLREIQGRSTDFVVAQDGRVMHGLALIYVLRDIPGIKAFKIIQHALDRVEVLIQADAGLHRVNMRQHVVQGIRQRLGEGVEVEVVWVDEAPREASGKFRYVVSHVSHGRFGASAGATHA